MNADFIDYICYKINMKFIRKQKGERNTQKQPNRKPKAILKAKKKKKSSEISDYIYILCFMFNT